TGSGGGAGAPRIVLDRDPLQVAGVGAIEPRAELDREVIVPGLVVVPDDVAGAEAEQTIRVARWLRGGAPLELDEGCRQALSLAYQWTGPPERPGGALGDERVIPDQG